MQHITHFKAVVVFITVLVVFIGNAFGANSFVIENFASVNPQVEPNNCSPSSQYFWTCTMWNNYPDDFTDGPDIANPPSGSFALDPTAPGGAATTVHITNKGLYYERRSVTNGASDEFFVRDRLTTSPSNQWQLNTYNKISAWIKVPSDWNLEKNDGTHNIAVAMFCKYPNSTNIEEDNNCHFYHYFNLMNTTAWQLMVIDSHPDSQRGASGGVDQGDIINYMKQQPNYNTFDLWTRFYFDTDGYHTTNGDFKIANIQAYQDTTNFNLRQVHSINAAYESSTNTIYVAWRRYKDDNSVNYDVRYAFSDIFALGYSNATPAPGGTNIPPLGFQGYAGAKYKTTGIDVRGRSSIFIAIKPVNSSLFSQVEIPLTGNTSTISSPPQAPSNLTLQ